VPGTPRHRRFSSEPTLPPKPSRAGRSLTGSSHLGPARAPLPGTDLLVQGRGVGPHSEVGLGAVLLDVLQVVPIVVHNQASGVVEENSHAVVTQLVTCSKGSPSGLQTQRQRVVSPRVFPTATHQAPARSKSLPFVGALLLLGICHPPLQHHLCRDNPGCRGGCACSLRSEASRRLQQVTLSTLKRPGLTFSDRCSGFAGYLVTFLAAASGGDTHWNTCD